VPTSLTLQALLKSAAAKAGLGEQGVARASGLTPAAQAFYLATVANRHAPAPRPGSRGRTVVAIAATDADAEQMTSDVRFFLAALEGLSEAAVQEAVLPLPSHEVDPYRGLAPHMSVMSARTRALHAAAAGTARVIVSSATALLPRLSAPDRLIAASIALTAGDEIDPARLASRLVEAGFNREDPVDEHGEFCIRGGVIDVFPVGSERPLRLDFIGDTIESIREYDPATQRSVGEVRQALVLPLREVFAPGGASSGRVSPKLDLDRATEGGPSDEEDLSWAWQGDDDRDAEEDSGFGIRDSGSPPPADANPVVEANALLEPGADLSATLLDYLGQPFIYVSEPDAVRARAEKSLAQYEASHGEMALRGRQLPPPASLFIPLDDLDALLSLGTVLEELELAGGTPLPLGAEAPRSGQASTVSTTSIPSPSFHSRIADWVSEIRAARAAGETVLFVAETPGRAERTVEVLKDYELLAVPVFVDPRHRDNLQARGEMVHGASVLVATGLLSRGFRLPAAALRIFSETDVFEEERRPSDRRRAATKTFLSDFRDLKVGDHVVHVDHGIGVFVGLKQIPVDPYGGPTQEFLELRYAGEDKLFVPVERLDLLQKYTGAGRPSLDRLGGTTWEKAKTRVKKAMRDMAEELLKLYAARKALAGHSFSPDSHWHEEFDAAFPYELTTDQQAAVEDIRRDMESSTPMDRLLCGDVGYGKTEVAMRAAFKAVMDGKQVAVLAPTTVLAFQHLKTLRERFAGFPVTIDMVSRFRTRGEIRQTLDDLEAGKVDIIVGTHRLLSKDVTFKDLGLLVVDEEQRFGVAHKERIKQMRRKVDVLTMTATPIPRTLNMSLVGIRDMSVIETPPKDRLAIQTNVVRFDQDLIARAVRGEIARGGQVYFIHNRVESIYSIGHLLQRLVPEARVVVGHGQMGEESLERAMVDFVARKFDVLLATTIVENGLDIPNVNTIVINRADRYGLSQLYQLRGRVGRSDRPAYAYLLVPPSNTLSPVARKRLAAIREFSELGSGFRVAALDLEIRGAGNLLGGEQSGHIEAIGFEMYTKLLEQTVRELKGEEIEDETRATVNLGVDLRIDEEYVPEQNQRLGLYRRVASARSDAEIDAIVTEIEDRYGPMPSEVRNLVDYGRIRVRADRLGVEKIDRQGPVVVLTFKGSNGPEPERVMRLLREQPDLTLAPPSGLKLDLSGLTRLSTRGPDRIPATGRRAIPKRGTAGAARSWWTARATEEEVKPGFVKEAILRPAREDPRGPGGVLSRLTALLAELAGEQ
jgi:transcription-repair coupling factor (superfamily II helicase)